MYKRKVRGCHINGIKNPIIKHNIPDSLDELFENEEASYSIINEASPMDNTEAMQYFIKKLKITDNVLVNYGDRIEVENDNYSFHLEIHSGGMGDMFNHSFDVYLI